jgi:hypothetical protein
MPRSKDIKLALQDEEKYQEQTSRIRRLAYRRFQIDDENLLNFGVIQTPSGQRKSNQFELYDEVDFGKLTSDPEYMAAVTAAIQGALPFMAIENETTAEITDRETRSAIERAVLQDLLDEDNLQN